jgi:hypothetical protein
MSSLMSLFGKARDFVGRRVVAGAGNLIRKVGDVSGSLSRGIGGIAGYAKPLISGVATALAPMTNGMSLPIAGLVNKGLDFFKSGQAAGLADKLGTLGTTVSGMGNLMAGY